MHISINPKSSWIQLRFQCPKSCPNMYDTSSTPPPLSKVTPHGSTHMYYIIDLIEHPNSEADSAKINCNYILVVSENAFMSRKWILD